MLMVLAWTGHQHLALQPLLLARAMDLHNPCVHGHGNSWMTNQLLVRLHGRHIKSVITDEDIAQRIHLHLQSLDKKFLCARDIVQYLDKPVVKEWLGLKKNTIQTHISVLDACHGVPVWEAQ